MKLLLQRNIENLGKAGDLVEVSPGYARNYLLPHGLALEPTAGNLKRVDELRAIARQQEFELLQELTARAQTLDGLDVVVKSRANELGHLFGSVGAADVSVALKELGFDVSDQKIILDPHVKEVGDYDVQIKFADEASAQIKLHILPETPPANVPEDLEQDQEQDDSQAQSESSLYSD